VQPVQSPLYNQMLDAIVRASASLGVTSSEDDFQRLLASQLVPSERELRATFADAAIAPRRPPASAIEDLTRRKLPRVVPPEGVDPCAARAKLDILWHSPTGAVPIELKFCAKWKADTNGYAFLKDIHRLERMIGAGSHVELADYRYAAFVTNESVYWRGERPEPKPFWLRDGSEFAPGRWVQYDQKSPDTLWYSYPPFYLANPYRRQWRELTPTWKCLLVEVRLQESP
jgi:hypothetical protein